MCDYLEVNIFMTQNNMLPAYTKVNQAKLIFYFYFTTFPRVDSIMYLVNIVTHINASEPKFSTLPSFDISNNC